ncbi:hypothetical protein HanPI659440_Chr03g0096531 [Helianthus annuus]|nr:hypothetical protein HanPI659440_Chr03g0096531 [Helianthus annuus]
MVHFGFIFFCVTMKSLWGISILYPSSPYGNSNGYCKARYDGCNSLIRWSIPD